MLSALSFIDVESRMLGRLSGILASLVVAVILTSPAAAQKAALVIGNSDYKNAIALPNAVNDAGDIGSALSRLGFAVTRLTNGTADDMRRAVAEFGDKAKGADIALIFFAGHAVEIEGMHWSIPIDGKVDSLEAIQGQSVSLDRILASSAGSKLAIVLIDTARDNPFATEGKPAARAQSKSQPKTPPKAQSKAQPKNEPKAQAEPKHVLILYSTGPGGRPLDGEGRNSPFAAALMKHLETPGLDLQKLAASVRDEVAVATKGQQIPFSYALLPNADVVLVPR